MNGKNVVRGKAGPMPGGVSYAQVPKEAIEDTGLSPNAFRLYAYLCLFSGKDGKAFPKVRTLAIGLDVSRRTIQRTLNELEDSGWVERDFKKNRSTNYIVNRDPTKKAEISFRNRKWKKRRVWRKKKGSGNATKPWLTTGLSPRSDASVTQTGATSVAPIKDSKKTHLKETPRSPNPAPATLESLNLHSSGNCAGDQTGSHPSQCSANTPDQDRAIGWEDLGIEARRVFPNLTKEEAYEWLTDFLFRLQEDDVSFMEDVRFFYGLVHGALKKITDDTFEDMGLDDGAKLAKLEQLIRAEIDHYGERGKSLKVPKNRPVG